MHIANIGVAIDDHLRAQKLHLLPGGAERNEALVQELGRVYFNALETLFTEDAPEHELSMWHVEGFGPVKTTGRKIDWLPDVLLTAAEAVMRNRGEQPVSYIDRIRPAAAMLSELAEGTLEVRAIEIRDMTAAIKASGGESFIHAVDKAMGRASQEARLDVRSQAMNAWRSEDREWIYALPGALTAGQFLYFLSDTDGAFERSKLSRQDWQRLMHPLLAPHRSQLSPFGPLAGALQQAGILRKGPEAIAVALDCASQIPGGLEDAGLLEALNADLEKLARLGGAGRRMLANMTNDIVALSVDELSQASGEPAPQDIGRDAALFRCDGYQHALNEMSTPILREARQRIDTRLRRHGPDLRADILLLSSRISIAMQEPMERSVARVRQALEWSFTDFSHPGENPASRLTLSALGGIWGQDDIALYAESHVLTALDTDAFDDETRAIAGRLSMLTGEIIAEDLQRLMTPKAGAIMAIVSEMPDFSIPAADAILATILKSPQSARVLHQIAEGDVLTMSLFEGALAGNEVCRSSVADPEGFAQARGMTGAMLSKLMTLKPGVTAVDLVDPELVQLANDPLIEDGNRLRQVQAVCAPLAVVCNVDIMTMRSQLEAAGYSHSEDPLAAGELSRIYAETLSNGQNPAEVAVNYIDLLRSVAQATPTSPFDDAPTSSPSADQHFDGADMHDEPPDWPEAGPDAEDEADWNHSGDDGMSLSDYAAGYDHSGQGFDDLPGALPRDLHIDPEQDAPFMPPGEAITRAAGGTTLQSSSAELDMFDAEMAGFMAFEASMSEVTDSEVDEYLAHGQSAEDEQHPGAGMTDEDSQMAFSL